MSDLRNVVFLSAQQLETLMEDGTITVGDITINFDNTDIYMTSDDDKYVLYSSTGTVTTATPSAGTDAVNLDYFEANLPVVPTYYNHKISVSFYDEDLGETVEKIRGLEMVDRESTTYTDPQYLFDRLNDENRPPFLQKVVTLADGSLGVFVSLSEDLDEECWEVTIATLGGGNITVRIEELFDTVTEL